MLAQNPANKDVAKILKLLLKNYGSVYSNDKIDRNIINETNTWLTASSRAKEEFEKPYSLTTTASITVIL